MKGRTHFPHTATGRDKGSRPGSHAPQGIASSWPSKGTQNATGNYRRVPLKRHPQCSTDKHPHRRLTRYWLRQGYSLEQAQHFVRTKLVKGDALGQRAIDVYSKMGSVVPAQDGTLAAFPMTTGDYQTKVAGTNILELIGN